MIPSPTKNSKRQGKEVPYIGIDIIINYRLYNRSIQRALIERGTIITIIGATNNNNNIKGI